MKEFTTIRKHQVIRLGHWNQPNVPARRLLIRNLSNQTVRLPKLQEMNELFHVEPELPFQLEPFATAEIELRMAEARLGHHSHDLCLRWDGGPEDDIPVFRLHGFRDVPLK